MNDDKEKEILKKIDDSLTEELKKDFEKVIRHFPTAKFAVMFLLNILCYSYAGEKEDFLKICADAYDRARRGEKNDC